jgi:uncharacterized linocin/CFP29 family protein
MPDYLQRDQAPLSASQWNLLTDAAVSTARSILVDRRFVTLVGPFGPAVEAVPAELIGGGTGGEVNLFGQAEGEAVMLEHRRFVPLPLIYKDFWLHWRDIDANRQLGFPLGIGEAAAAASSVALAEDRLVFDGDPSLDLPGLRTVEGRQTLPMRDWTVMGNAFADVVDGMRRLTATGFPGPYALVVTPLLYAELNRIFDGTGVLELEQVQKLARRGVYPSAVLPEGSALLVDSGAQNMDLAVGLDLSVAFVSSENMNYKFRVVESIVPRIRRPAAICSFVAGPGGSGGESS